MMGECVLITGSSRGLGRELAKVYAKNGCKVILHGKDPSRLANTLNELHKQDLKGGFLTCSGDIAVVGILEKIVDVSQKENVSTLINNAAIYFNGCLEEELTERILETNFLAPINLTKKLFPYFVSQGGGKIINLISIDVSNTKGYQAGYTASKSGLMAFMDSLRFEAKEKNVRVVNILLGGMNTDMYRGTGRDASLCMNPSEVAEIIFNSTKTYTLTGVDSITINRQKY